MEVIFNNVLVGGVILASLGLVIFAVMRREVLLRSEAWWCGNDFVTMVCAPAVAISLGAGFALTISGIGALGATPVPAAGWALAVAAIIVAACTLVLLSRDIGDLASAARREAMAAS